MCVFLPTTVGSKRGSRERAVAGGSMMVRLRVTAGLVDWTMGACLEERLSRSLYFDDFEDDEDCFCSRASRMRARMSSRGLAGCVSALPSGAEDFARLVLRGPMEDWAFARAPKEILFREDWISSWSSSSSSSSSSSCCSSFI